MPGIKRRQFLSEIELMDLSQHRANKEDLLALLDLLPIPSVLALDAECREVRMNRAFTEMLGLPGQSAAHQCPPGGWDRPYVYMRDGRILKPEELPLWKAVELRGEVRHSELELHMNDGRVFHLVGNAAPLFDDAGTISGSVATFMNVTDSRALQLSNDELASRLQYLAEVGLELSESLDMRAVLDTLGRILVPRFADCVSITIVDEQNRLSTTRVHHQNRQVLQDLIELRANTPLSEASRFPVTHRVMETGQGEIVEDLSAMMLHPDADDVYREFIRTMTHDFNFRKAVVVPMKNRGVFSGLFTAIGGAERAYTQTDLRMLEELGRRAASAIDNAQSFERHRRSSETLQEALLPSHLPKLDQVHFDAVYVPGDDEAQVGGDWYDAFELEDGRIVLSIGDVTGRGVQAAVIMGKIRHAIKALTVYESDPAKLLNAADNVLRRSAGDAIVTALVGVLDTSDGTFTYATAGHPAPYLRRADGIVLLLPCHGLPLGLRTDEPQAVHVKLRSGDLVLLYTDGLLESTHDLQEGERRIRSALGELNSETLHEAAHAIRSAVLYDGSRDDVALIAMTIHALKSQSTDDMLEWSFNSGDAQLAHASRSLFLSYLLQRGIPGDDYAGAELVFGELIGNVVRHTAGRATVRVNWTGPYPELQVVDSGKGFDLETALPKDVLSEAGRGLFLINALTREFDIKSLPSGGTCARAILDIHAG
ncbi:MAG: SpoIIE family protein phosphatase [Candidatus Eremiobacteraeota bacterium]|nr:SpoIIE family protein phosphatase [Candidatus Eremiobacteraeota bacterium]